MEDVKMPLINYQMVTDRKGLECKFTATPSSAGLGVFQSAGWNDSWGFG